MAAGTQRRIAVVGAGAWGTALAQTLGAAGHEVLLWAHSAATAAMASNVTRVHGAPPAKSR